MTEKSDSKKSSCDIEPTRSESKSSRDRKSKKDAVKPPTKIVIRRLPPSMDEEGFVKAIEPMPDHDEFYFVSADWSLGKNAASRAYINFTNYNDIFLFRDKFDGYIFLDNKGAEYPAVVEFAPFQELPRNRSRKKDSKSNSIETDTHFVAFLEALNSEKDSTGTKENKPEYSYQIKDDKKITSTPLLEYIANKKLERREEKRKKIEEKKKARDEERQKRRNQTAKNIPEPIKEENKDDDIVVRIIPSRLDPNQRNKRNTEKVSSESTKGEKENHREREKNRRKEREKERNRDRERGRDRQQRRDKDKEKDREKEPVKKVEEKAEVKAIVKEVPNIAPAVVSEHTPTPVSTNISKASVAPKAESEFVKSDPLKGEPPKREVKKYSERRKETRARAENRLAENESKSVSNAEPDIKEMVKPKELTMRDKLRPDVEPFIPKDKARIVIRNVHELSEPPAEPVKKIVETVKIEEKEDKEPEPVKEAEIKEIDSSNEKSDKKEGSEERKPKIRNKDRPSIQIYQPGKRRLSSLNKSEDDKGKDKSDSDKSGEKSPHLIDEKRHKLTKRREKERDKDKGKLSRKNSSDAETSSKGSHKEKSSKGKTSPSPA